MSGDDSLREILIRNFEMLTERTTKPYDGVLGTPPDWVPRNFQFDFEITRNKLLGAGYSPADLVAYVDEYIDFLRIAAANPEEAGYFRHSIPFDIMAAISLLAELKNAVQLGPKDGLASLIGPLHAEQIGKAEKYREHQSKNASKPRNRIKANGEEISITTIVEKLALRVDELGAYLPHKDLWAELYAELDKLGLNPKETTKNKNPFSIEYDVSDDGARKSIKYASFKAMVSKKR